MANKMKHAILHSGTREIIRYTTVLNGLIFIWLIMRTGDVIKPAELKAATLSG